MLKEVEALAESIRKHGPDPEFMKKMETRVRHSGILVDGKQYVPYSVIPVFFNDDDMEFLNRKHFPVIAGKRYKLLHIR